MSYIWEGISLGLFLAASMGPIFVALTQTSLEKGSLAGFSVASGVWVSDFIILGGSMFTIREIADTVNGEDFQFWLGTSGAIILFAYGVMLILTKPKRIKAKESMSMKSFGGYWLKGFLINTVNPFTFVFWLGVMSTYIIGRSTSKNDLITLIVTIMTIIMLSDSFKIILAKLIRDRLRPVHIMWISRTAGIGLIIFGAVLMWKVL